MMSNKQEWPSFCPFCGEHNDWEFIADGSEDDTNHAFRTINDARDFACYFDQDEDEVPEHISDMVASILPYDGRLANTLWNSLSEIVGDGSIFDPLAAYEARVEFNVKVKSVSKYQLAMLIARYAFAGGLIYREYLNHGGQRLASMRGN